MGIDGKGIKGRGATAQVPNRFLQRSYAVEHIEGVDEPVDEQGRPTQYRIENARSLVNRVDAPDLPFGWSMNPYQGCEHGCAYCYARPTHEYYGLSAGLDFERVVLVKRNAPALLEKFLRSPGWRPEAIMLSGNTDPYQPVERAERITRGLVEVMHRFRNPLSIITKNALVLRDLDLLREMAADRLVSVAISITTLDEDLRRTMEPRTSTAANRLRAIEALSAAGIPVFAMVAPLIPALNDKDAPAVLKAAADAGAWGAGFTVVRTNGAVAPVFEQWLRTHYPDRADKVLAQVAAMHGGSVEDTRSGRRMRGEGPFAEAMGRLFRVLRQRYFAGRNAPVLETGQFRVPPSGQLDLFA